MGGAGRFWKNSGKQAASGAVTINGFDPDFVCIQHLISGNFIITRMISAWTDVILSTIHRDLSRWIIQTLDTLTLNRLHWTSTKWDQSISPVSTASDSPSVSRLSSRSSGSLWSGSNRAKFSSKREKAVRQMVEWGTESSDKPLGWSTWMIREQRCAEDFGRNCAGDK